jgi:hypothetical protein
VKLWIDYVRPAPSEYYWCKDIFSAKEFIMAHNNLYENNIYKNPIELIDIGISITEHDNYRGYIAFLDWLKNTKYNYLIQLHSTNFVDIEKLKEYFEMCDAKQEEESRIYWENLLKKMNP